MHSTYLACFVLLLVFLSIHLWPLLSLPGLIFVCCNNKNTIKKCWIIKRKEIPSRNTSLGYKSCQFLLFVVTQRCSDWFGSLGLGALGTLWVESWQGGCVKYQKTWCSCLQEERNVGLMGSEQGGRVERGFSATLDSRLFWEFFSWQKTGWVQSKPETKLVERLKSQLCSCSLYSSPHKGLLNQRWAEHQQQETLS